jgi:hypothetical protein
MDEEILPRVDGDVGAGTSSMRRLFVAFAKSFSSERRSPTSAILVMDARISLHLYGQISNTVIVPDFNE